MSEPTETEQHLLKNLTSEQLRLVAAWLEHEAILRSQAGYSEEVYNSFKYVAHRLMILAKPAFGEEE